MSKKHQIISIVIWSLVSFGVGAALTARAFAAQEQAIMSHDREQIQIAEAQRDTCRNTVNLMTAKSTVLYEAAPVGVDVLNGIARVEAGRRVIDPALIPKRAAWVVPFAVKPIASNDTRGAAYAYLDHKTGAISRPD